MLVHPAGERCSAGRSICSGGGRRVHWPGHHKAVVLPDPSYRLPSGSTSGIYPPTLRKMPRSPAGHVRRCVWQVVFRPSASGTGRPGCPFVPISAAGGQSPSGVRAQEVERPLPCAPAPPPAPGGGADAVAVSMSWWASLPAAPFPGSAARLSARGKTSAASPDPSRGQTGDGRRSGSHHGAQTYKEAARMRQSTASGPADVQPHAPGGHHRQQQPSAVALEQADNRFPSDKVSCRAVNRARAPGRSCSSPAGICRRRMPPT